MSKGIVYILTNPCLDGWTKIGMSERDDIEARLNELNSPPNIPLSYRCYAVYRVNEPLEVEKNIHSIIDKIDDSLRAKEKTRNGRIRKREFFKISPEAAYSVFKNIASLRGDVENLRLYAPTANESQEEELAETKSKRSNNSFKLLEISVGEKLAFLYDDNIVVKVANDKNQVELGGAYYSVTALACKILIEKYGWSDNLHVNGWRYFTKDGVTLSDLRDKIENEECEE